MRVNLMRGHKHIVSTMNGTENGNGTENSNGGDSENLNPEASLEAAGGEGAVPDQDNVTPLHEDSENPDRLSPEAEADPRTYEELFDDCTDLKDRLLRAIAETENLRRRAQREKEDAAKYAITAFARDMVEIQDNMIRALASGSPEDKAAGGDHLATMYEGVELTQRSLQSAFERHKIEIINPAGQKFDPNFHQAVAEIPGTPHANGTVVDVMQTGYIIGDRLLRAAMVTVAKGAPVGGGETPGGTVDTSA